MAHDHFKQNCRANVPHSGNKSCRVVLLMICSASRAEICLQILFCKLETWILSLALLSIV